jgi:phosphomevalonate kinase
MATIEIVLLVIGVIMMVGSFFITEKLSNGDLDKIAELSTEEMQRILERNLDEAQSKVNDTIDQVIEQSIGKSMEVVDRALDKETNEKMQAINEYSDTVLEAIHKTHNEVMFLYSMLNDKHTELTNYAGNLAQLAIFHYSAFYGRACCVCPCLQGSIAYG